jgi:serine/threonine protein kinase
MDKCKDKICDKNKICNPPSGRCVKQDGKIGKELLKNNNNFTKENISNNFAEKNIPDKCPISALKGIKHNYGNQFNNFIKSVDINMQFIKLLGKGKCGTVYLICHNNNQQDCKVIKIEKFKGNIKTSMKDFQQEIHMQQKFYKIGLAPNLIKSGFFASKPKYYGAIIMDKVDGTLRSLLKIQHTPQFLDIIIEELLYIVDKLCRYNLVHGDMHFDNIAIHNKKLILIDFGFACCILNKIKCNPRLEFSQLLNSCTWGDFNEFNKNYIYDKLVYAAQHKYNLNFPTRSDKHYIKILRKIWNDTHDAYVPSIDKDINLIDHETPIFFK